MAEENKNLETENQELQDKILGMYNNIGNSE